MNTSRTFSRAEDIRAFRLAFAMMAQTDSEESEAQAEAEAEAESEAEAEFEQNQHVLDTLEEGRVVMDGNEVPSMTLYTR